MKHDHVLIDKEGKIVACNTKTYLDQCYVEEIRSGKYKLISYKEYEKSRKLGKRHDPPQPPV